MPEELKPARWNAAEMRAAIDEFERTGDYAPCLRLLGVTEGRNPLLVLQDALKRAGNRRERDAFEDIALRCARGGSSGHAAAPAPEELIRRAREHYGSHAERFLTVEQARGLASGLWRLCEPPPTENCLLAILGMEIEKAVSDSVGVTSRNFGETMSLFHANCDRCGGSKRGRGNIVCPKCLARAKTDLQLGLATGLFSVRGDDPPDIDELAPLFLKQKAEDYGCHDCGDGPIRPCACARELRIPSRPKDGEVVRGKEIASGQEHFFCLRVEQD